MSFHICWHFKNYWLIRCLHSNNDHNINFLKISFSIVQLQSVIFIGKKKWINSLKINFNPATCVVIIWKPPAPHKLTDTNCNGNRNEILLVDFPQSPPRSSHWRCSGPCLVPLCFWTVDPSSTLPSRAISSFVPFLGPPHLPNTVGTMDLHFPFIFLDFLAKKTTSLASCLWRQSYRASPPKMKERGEHLQVASSLRCG